MGHFRRTGRKRRRGGGGAPSWGCVCLCMCVRVCTIDSIRNDGGRERGGRRKGALLEQMKETEQRRKTIINQPRPYPSNNSKQKKKEGERKSKFENLKHRWHLSAATRGRSRRATETKGLASTLP